LLSEEWRLEMMKTLDRPESFFKTFFKQNFKKRRCDAAMLLVTDFKTISQIANHSHT